MTEFRETDSGLAIPVEPKPKPKREYRPMELQDEERREKAQWALKLLTEAMDLIHGTSGFSGIPGIGQEGKVDAARRQVHGELHRCIGRVLLGKDYWGWEELT